MAESKTDAYGVVLETAHPAKFIDVVEDVLKLKIDLPLPLAEAASKVKNAMLIENNFSALKDFLITKSN